MTAAAARREATESRREAKAREISNIFIQSDHHRAIWGLILKNPRLHRVLLDDPEVLKTPVDVVEDVFINEVFATYLTSWRVATAGGFITLEELAVDAKWFFSLPLPASMWEKTKGYKNVDFVAFVKRARETMPNET